MRNHYTTGYRVMSLIDDQIELNRLHIERLSWQKSIAFFATFNYLTCFFIYPMITSLLVETVFTIFMVIVSCCMAMLWHNHILQIRKRQHYEHCLYRFLYLQEHSYYLFEKIFY